MLAENVLKMINSSNHKKPKYYTKINNGSDSKNVYENKNRSKSVKTKNKKTESTGPESRKDGKQKITKKAKWKICI